MNTNPLAKRILCFGDSNTRGFIAGSGGERRYDAQTRWTGRLQALLGTEYEIIEEGLDARMTRNDDPRPGYVGKNAAVYLTPCMESHRPLQLLILMLGTPDLKRIMNLTAQQIADGLEQLVRMAKASATGTNSGPPQVLILSPAPIIDTTPYARAMFDGCAAKSFALAGLYREVAHRHACAFLDVGECARVDENEGIHLTRESHAALASRLALLIDGLRPM